MSRQDRATTDRNARTLRELVKQPDNKACADCRKNDARWASWNLGVFLCIRCSGIHRSMGTHISKVKSIDLDMWTPEQMESVQKWGNRRANLYWEKHLKAGHVPADHKIESFIRSKYESKRWAMDGPPPLDPSVLESGSSVPPQPVASTPPRPTPTPTSTAPAPAPAQRAAHPLLSRASRPTAPPVLAPVVNLFDDDEASSFAPTPTPAAISTHQGTGQPPPTVAATAPVSQSTAPPAPTQPSTSIFDLDFRAPSTTAKPQTAKADIMSLFSNTTPSSAPSTASPNQGSFFSPSGNSAAIPATNPYSSWGGGVTSSAPPVQTQPTQTSTAGWGMQVDQNAWGAPPVQSQASQGSAGQSGWAGNAGGAAGGSGVGADPWANTGNVNAGNIGGFASPPVVAKKDERDPFANIWG